VLFLLNRVTEKGKTSALNVFLESIKFHSLGQCFLKIFKSSYTVFSLHIYIIAQELVSVKRILKNNEEIIIVLGAFANEVM
jgi:hypothetical protein